MITGRRPATRQVREDTLPAAHRIQKIRAALLMLLAVVFIACAAYLAATSARHLLEMDGMDVDNGVFAELARVHLDGQTLYRDRWDNKPPGMFLFTAVFVAALGNTLTAIDSAILAADALLGLACGGLALALTRRLPYALVAGLVAFLYAAVIGKLETTVLMAAFGAGSAALAVAGRGRARWMVASGVLFMAGFLTKQPIMVELPIVLLLAAQHAPGSRWRAAGWVLIGSGALGLLFLGWLASSGTLQAFWEYVFASVGHYVLTDSGEWHFSEAGTQLFEQVFLARTLPRLAPLLIGAALAAIVLVASRRERRKAGILLGWLVLTFAAASVGRSWKLPYFIQIIPPAVALAVVGAAFLQRVRPGALLPVLALAYLGLGFFAARYVGPLWVAAPVAPEVEVASFVAERTTPDDCIWPWGSINLINFLAARDSCVPTVSESHVMLTNQYPVVSRRIQFLLALFARPPALHVWGSDWGYFPQLERYAARYLAQPVFRNEHFVVYEMDTTPWHPHRVTFGDAIALLGYDLPPRDAYCGGNALPLAMTWQQLRRPEHQYQMFAQLLTADEGAKLSGVDLPPDDRPTYAWVDSGDVRLGPPFTLPIPAETPAGTFKLVVGLYEVETLAPLPVTDGADGGIERPYAVLTEVIVQECE